MINKINVLMGTIIVVVLSTGVYLQSDTHKENILRQARIYIHCEKVYILNTHMKVKQKNSYLLGRTRLGDIYGDLIKRTNITIDDHCIGYL